MAMVTTRAARNTLHTDNTRTHIASKANTQSNLVLIMLCTLPPLPVLFLADVGEQLGVLLRHGSRNRVKAKAPRETLYHHANLVQCNSAWRQYERHKACLKNDRRTPP